MDRSLPSTRMLRATRSPGSRYGADGRLRLPRSGDPRSRSPRPVDMISTSSGWRTAPAVSPRITEVQRMESDVITLQDIFEFKIDSFAPDGTINCIVQPPRACARLPRQVREARHRPACGRSSRSGRPRRTWRTCADDALARSFRWRSSRRSRRFAAFPAFAAEGGAASRSSRSAARSSPTARTG